MHFDKIEDYSFSHGLHFNPNTGEYHSLNPHDLGRPLTHEEMDYNLIYQKQTLNGWRIVGGNDDFTLKQSDLGKVLKFHEIANTDDDFSRYSSGGLFVNQRVWVPADLAVADPCAGFQVINSGATNSLTYQPLLTTMATTESPLGTSATNATTQGTQATFATTLATTEATTTQAFDGTSGSGSGTTLATTTTQQMGPAILQHNTQTYEEDSSGGSNAFYDYNAQDSNGAYLHNNQTIVASYENPLYGNMTGGTDTYIRSQQNGVNLQVGDVMEWWNPIENEWGLISDWGMGPDRRGVYEDTTGIFSNANENWIVTVQNGILTELIPFSQITNITVTYNANANTSDITGNFTTTETRTIGQAFSAPGPTFGHTGGWTFLAWSPFPNGGSPEYAPGDPITLQSSNDVTFYAQWLVPTEGTTNATNATTQTPTTNIGSGSGDGFATTTSYGPVNTTLPISTNPGGGGTNATSATTVGTNATSATTVGTNATSATTVGTSATTVGTSATTELPITEATTVGTSATTQAPTTIDSGAGGGTTTTSSGGGSGQTNATTIGTSGTSATTQAIATNATSATTVGTSATTQAPITTSSGGGSGQTNATTQAPTTIDSGTGGGSGQTNATTVGTIGTSATTDAPFQPATTSSGGGGGALGQVQFRQYENGFASQICSGGGSYTTRVLNISGTVTEAAAWNVILNNAEVEGNSDQYKIIGLSDENQNPVSFADGWRAINDDYELGAFQSCDGGLPQQ